MNGIIGIIMCTLTNIEYCRENKLKDAEEACLKALDLMILAYKDKS